MKSALIIRMAWVCLTIAFITFCAQVETADETEDDSIFEPTYLSYDDIYRDFTQKKMCKRCHPAIWREWERSMHAKAWEDPIYQEAASQVEDREKTCDPCHTPEPILITGIGKMPKLRTEDRKYGVSCIVCHIDAHGAMHGPHKSANPMYHANVTSEAHAEPTELCATCHGQPSVPEHNQVASFKNSPAAEKGQNCASCHMPAVKRTLSVHTYEPVTVRRHTWAGSRSVSKLRSAANLKIVRADGKATVRLTNKAGHLLPGEALRAIILDVTISAPDSVVNRREQAFISEASDKPEHSRIQPGETREFVYTLNDTEKIEAKLLYRLIPTTPETEWIKMAEASQ